jgi:hypothetical protein
MESLLRRISETTVTPSYIADACISVLAVLSLLSIGALALLTVAVRAL